MMLLVWIFALPYDIPGARRPESDPIETLKLRYARGDISSEEFKERRTALEASSSGTPTKTS